MKKIINVFLFMAYFISFCMTFIMVNINNPLTGTLLENNNIIEFNIKNNYVSYRIDGEDSYDIYLIRNKYSISEIYDFVKYRNESIFYDLTKFLYNNHVNYLNLSDLQIIESLKYLTKEKKYRNEFKNKKQKTLLIINRIKQIKETNKYMKIYKEYLLEEYVDMIK